MKERKREMLALYLTLLSILYFTIAFHFLQKNTYSCTWNKSQGQPHVCSVTHLALETEFSYTNYILFFIKILLARIIILFYGYLLFIIVIIVFPPGKQKRWYNILVIFVESDIYFFSWWSLISISLSFFS